MSASKQFKTQTGSYKVKVKSGQWQGYNTVRLEISVGQPYHEGDKFKSTTDWAKDRFTNVALLVNDTLQRYNLMFENKLSESAAERITYKLGSEWIQRNYSAIHECQVARWDDWRSKAEYEEIYDKIRNLFDSNEQFKKAVLKSTDDVWERRAGNHSAYTLERKEEFYSLSIAYLIEETAVLAMAYKAFPGVSVYPGSFQEMWSMFVGNDIEGAPEGLNNAYCVRIDFAKRKAA